jgi:hypothetical protein
MGKNSIKAVGSSIQRSVDAEGMTPRRRVPSRDGGYVLAALLALWLCYWAVAWAEVAGLLARGVPDPDVALFLWVWLGGWTIGGIIFMGVLWRLLSPDRPPSVGSPENKRQHSTEGICTPYR